MNSVEVKQNQTLDDVCYAYYGKTQAIVEQVLNANQGLCELGPIVPAGTTIVMPEITSQAKTKTINVWD